MLHHKVNSSFFAEPTVEHPVPQTNPKSIDAQNFFGFLIKCNGDTDFFFGMSPMKMGFRILFSSFREYPAIGLVFDIQKLGGVEPMSWIVFHSVAANGLGKGFTHHSARIPNCFYGASISNGFVLFRTITNSKNIFNIGFQKSIHLNSTT
jgi:hypothetical protein